jgi:hypothetical protein
MNDGRSGPRGGSGDGSANKKSPTIHCQLDHDAASRPPAADQFGKGLLGKRVLKLTAPDVDAKRILGVCAGRYSFHVQCAE